MRKNVIQIHSIKFEFNKHSQIAELPVRSNYIMSSVHLIDDNKTDGDFVIFNEILNS